MVNDIPRPMKQASPTSRDRIYVATMDDDTCPSCASRHGVTVKSGEETHVIPNPYCTSPHGCRCEWESTPRRVTAE